MDQASHMADSPPYIRQTPQVTLSLMCPLFFPRLHNL
jgi:hypothetical protein